MVPNEDEGENGKHKPPNLTRLMRSRLEKLVNKTDSQCVYFPNISSCTLSDLLI